MRSIPASAAGVVVNRSRLHLLLPAQSDSISTRSTATDGSNRITVMLEQRGSFDVLIVPYPVPVGLAELWGALCLPAVSPAFGCSGKIDVRKTANRFELTFADSNLISSLFSQRPRTVSVVTRENSSERRQNVQVRYSDPQIPFPIYAAIDAVYGSGFGSPIPSVRRNIVSAPNFSSYDAASFVLQLGDTLSLRADKDNCRYDSCYGGSVEASWNSADTSTVAIAPVPPPQSGRFSYPRPAVIITARKPGATNIIASPPATTSTGVQYPLDDTLSALVTVIPRVGSLRLETVQDTVFSWQPVRLSIELRDESGGIIRGVPAGVRWIDDRSHGPYTVTDTGFVTLYGKSRAQVITATFRNWSDSIVVQVRDTLSEGHLTTGLRDSSVDAILRFNRETALGNGMIVSVLRQRDGPQSYARIDSLIDSLVARTLADDGIGMRIERANNAVSLLAGSTVNWSSGIPYRRGSKHFIRIYRESRNVTHRLSALSGLSNQSDTGTVLSYLKRLAVEGDNLGAASAVRLLIEAGNANVDRAVYHLKDLIRSRRVVQPYAVVLLKQYAEWLTAIRTK